MYSEKNYSQQDSIKQIPSKSPSVSPVGGMFVDCWLGDPSKKANITEGWTQDVNTQSKLSAMCVLRVNIQ